MKRNFKALGLALVAVFAMSAIVAQAAQAKFDTTRTFPAASNAFVRAEADPTEPAQTFTAVTGGFKVICQEVSTTQKGNASNVTITDKSTGSTGEPHYNNCKNSIGGGATVRPNECTYTFESETDAAEHAHVQETCPAGKSIEIETSGCIIFIGTQRLNGIHYTNVQTGTGEKEMHITLSATVEDSITFTSNKAFGCGLGGIPAEGHEATYTGKSTIKGFEDKNKEEGAGQVGITYETLAGETMP